MADTRRIEVVAIATPAQLEQAYAIRRRVFIDEQKVPEEIELDDDDARAFHALALIDGVPVGTGRMLPHAEHEIKIGRMAVLRELRGSGIGREILEFLMNEARARGFRIAVLHAQLTAEGFYLRSGYQPIGDVFEEAGIAHRKMERPL
ncbi:MAG TPA: GNAT family N-acetyltransferase [Candidatus Binataceae bacterium]|nr:GNAT family N-acetyltransferase [Candidatus Binataceae bacterium]